MNITMKHVFHIEVKSDMLFCEDSDAEFTH